MTVNYAGIKSTGDPSEVFTFGKSNEICHFCVAALLQCVLDVPYFCPSGVGLTHRVRQSGWAHRLCCKRTPQRIGTI